MPEPLHPPYLPSATQQPRTLDRWLDINSQNGPLTRTQTFITLPAFTIPDKDRQNFSYAFLQAAFNFESPNSFSLNTANILQAFEAANTANQGELTFVVSIMYTDANNNVFRYLLWDGSTPPLLFYFNIPLYTGQVILKNFRLEIWNNPNGPPVNTVPINLFTSVLGGIDYRYGVDSALVNADPIITDTSVVLDGSDFDLPMFFPTGSAPQPN